MTLDDTTYQSHTDAIQIKLVEAPDAYGIENPSIPLTCVLDALSETLVNIVAHQLGTLKTVLYLEDIVSGIKNQIDS